ncbi:MAG TPA: hypothetical protein VFD02_02395 [Syntrophomonadaceae bacterium]|nr:hypothetical protein [Syntrophomonadaceae bacterium]
MLILLVGATYGRIAVPEVVGATCGRIAVPEVVGATCGRQFQKESINLIGGFLWIIK